ncbi:MAG TPA: phenylalanine--tRNA ligase subunit alpha, partial [Inquilinus sp.]|nr:phenylalanine--tRNA ligase subunit alpha [Inquilinus sp.]
MEQVETLKQELADAVAAAPDLAALDTVRVGALGKKGRLTGLMAGLRDLDPEARKAAGAALNVVKDEISAALDARKSVLERAALDARLARERLDVSLPVRPERTGRIHPISQTRDEMVAIFAEMGFSVAEGPDIEDDWHNFTALNIPPEHPARQMHDTFYLPDRPDGKAAVLRTHTSPVQVRTMLSQKPPIRVVVPGRTFRSDYDQTHTPMFHQIEGLVIDEAIHMGHLRGCLLEFCRTFFDVPDLPIRFRPSF